MKHIIIGGAIGFSITVFCLFLVRYRTVSSVDTYKNEDEFPLITYEVFQDTWIYQGLRPIRRIASAGWTRVEPAQLDSIKEFAKARSAYYEHYGDSLIRVKSEQINQPNK